MACGRLPPDIPGLPAQLISIPLHPWRHLGLAGEEPHFGACKRYELVGVRSTAPAAVSCEL